jgi:hypothetical protein
MNENENVEEVKAEQAYNIALWENVNASESEDKISVRFKTLDLQCPLTKDELQSSVDELIKVWHELDEKEADFASVKINFKNQITALTETVNKLRSIVEIRSKLKTIDCKIVFNWELGLKKFYERNTDIFIKEEEISFEDRQEKLDFETVGQPLTDVAKEGQEII